MSSVDRSATSTIEPLLLPDRPVDLVLKEHTTHRKSRFGLLAIRGLDCLGNFDACMAALNDKDEKNSWPSYFEELRAAVARSPETAASVREAFDKQRGAESAALYRMLWGYSAEDLKNGADADLVDGLSNLDSLDVRVLAFLNLPASPVPSFGYNPSDPAIKRCRRSKSGKEANARGRSCRTAQRPPQEPNPLPKVPTRGPPDTSISFVLHRWRVVPQHTHGLRDSCPKGYRAGHF